MNHFFQGTSSELDGPCGSDGIRSAGMLVDAKPVPCSSTTVASPFNRTHNPHDIVYSTARANELPGGERVA